MRKINSKILYGKNWRTINNYFKKNKKHFRCEYCSDPANTIHHIAMPYERKNNPVVSDNPYYFMILCKSCHWYVGRCPGQPFQEGRRIEFEKKTKGYSVTEMFKQERKRKELIEEG